MYKDEFYNQYSLNKSLLLSAIGPFVIAIIVLDVFKLNIPSTIFIFIITYLLFILLIRKGYTKKIVVTEEHIIVYGFNQKKIPILNIQSIYFIENSGSSTGTYQVITKSCIIEAKNGEKISLNEANFGRSFEEIISILLNRNPSILLK